MGRDEELLDAWRGGDNKAGTELYKRYFDGVFRFFRNKISTGTDDLVQRTFLACVEGRDRLRDDTSFRSYLFSTARNMLYLEYRRQCRDGSAVDFDATSAYDLSPTPSRVLAKKAELRLLLEALRRIPIDFQIALELYHWEDMTGPELARALGIPEATVRSRIRRGVEHVRRQLKLIAESGEHLESTLADLDGWARSLRHPVGPDTPSEPT